MVGSYIAAILAIYSFGLLFEIFIPVAGEPTNFTAIISESNNIHVNITVSWNSPRSNVTDYVIYCQSKGEPVISDRVSGGETETHSLDGLQRGVTYYISIVALSPHLPSPLVHCILVALPNSKCAPYVMPTTAAKGTTNTSYFTSTSKIRGKK